MRAWRERLWESHDRLASPRRTRAQMSPKEQAFVEAAMGDWRRPHRASLPRLRALAAEDPSLIAAAGPAALAMALAWEGGEPIVRFLLEEGARLDHEPGIFGPLDGAVWTGCLESVRLLLEAGGAPDPAGVAVEPPHGGLASHRTPLHTAAWLAQPEMTEVLLEHGAARTIEARLGEDGSTPLQRAVLANNWPTADPWARRDPNGRSNHRSGREVAALLLEYGAGYDIWSACGLDDVWRVAQLLREDPGVANAGDASGYTPLHWAAKQGALDCARLLLDASAEVDPDSNSLKTPLHQAAVAHQNMAFLPSNVDLMALLIEAGADCRRSGLQGPHAAVSRLPGRLRPERRIPDPPRREDHDPQPQGQVAAGCGGEGVSLSEGRTTCHIALAIPGLQDQRSMGTLCRNRSYRRRIETECHPVSLTDSPEITLAGSRASGASGG